MRNKKVIGLQYMPTAPRIPVWTGCILWLMLDRLNVNGAVCGVLWTVFAFLFCGNIYGVLTEKGCHPKDV